MSSHASLSPSSAHRWLTCSASVELCATLPKPESSRFAEEGTAAHEAAERAAAYAFGKITRGAHTRWVKRFKPEQGDADEMLRHAADYAELLESIASSMGAHTVLLEQRFETGIPRCWGTADAVLLSADALHVVDFKYGQGVKVSAQANPQMRLYALGALRTFDLLGGIERVAMTIYQPRIDWTSTTEVPASDLLEWRGEVKAIAERALTGRGDFAPSVAACRFCPAAAVCRPRMEASLAEDFDKPATLLEADEIGDLLHRIPQIKAWCASVESYALRSAVEDGVVIPGWKPVVGKGTRRVAPDRWPAALAELVGEGFDASKLEVSKPETLAALRKALGTKRFAALEAEGVIYAPPGAPKLVPEIAPGLSLADTAREDFA